VGLVVDLAGPDARWLGARAAFDLVRGGWGTRWREHPPLHTWLLYVLFDRRVPVAYRSWALDDINGFGYPIRRNAVVFVLIPAMQLVYPDGSGGMSVRYWLLWALMALSGLFLWPEGARKRARLKHVATRFGEMPVAGGPSAGDVPRERATARSMLTWTVLLLGFAAAGSVVSALLAPRFLLVSRMPGRAISVQFDVVPVEGNRIVMLAVVLVALGLGVLGAWVVRRRLGRLLGERADQPDRVLRPIRATGKVNVLFWAFLIAALGWLQVSGRFDIGLSQLLGALALPLLPGAVVALVLTRRADASDLAGADVWWIATRGRLPMVDRPAFGLLPKPSLADQAPGWLNGDSPA